MFDYLGSWLQAQGCDHTNSLTRKILIQLKIHNTEPVLNWSESKDGCCDCRILANIEEQFD